MGWSEEESRSGEDSSPWPFWSLARAKPIKGLKRPRPFPLVEAPSVFKKKKKVCVKCLRGTNEEL